MSLRCQYVDPTDLTTVLFDLNSVGGTFTGNGLAMFGDPSFGSAIRNANLLRQSGIAGAVVAATNDDVSTMAVELRAPQQANFDALRALAQALTSQVRAGGVIAYQPDGASQVEYIDAIPATGPALIGGQQNIYYQVAGQLMSGPLGLVIPVQPFGRWAPLSADLNTLANSGLLEDSNNNGVPDLYAFDSSTGLSGLAIDWSQQAFTFLAATPSVRSLQQVVTPAAAGDIWTASFYAWCNNQTKGRVIAVIDFLDGSNVVLATATGATTIPGTSAATAARPFVTSSAAPASTAKVRISLQVADTDATSVQHWWTRAQLEKSGTPSLYRTGAESCSNDLESTVPFAKHLLLYNPTNGPSKVQLSVHPENGAKVIATPLARRAQGNLAEFSRKLGVRAINASTLGVDASSQADANATGGNALRWTFATTTAMSQVFRNVFTPTDLSSFRGRFKVRAAVRPEVLTDKTLAQNIFSFQLRWSKSDPGANPSTFTSPTTVTFDTTVPTTSHYVPVDLGYITIDQNVSAVTIELWAARSSGTGNLWFDTIWFVPADELVAMPQVPGFLTPGQSPATSVFTDWVLTPDGCDTSSLGATYVTANQLAEGMVIPPAGGVVFPVGRHTFTIPNTGLSGISVQNGDGLVHTIGYLRARKSNTNPAKRVAWSNGVAKGVGDITWDPASPKKSRTFICTGAGNTGGSIPAAFATATDGQTGIADGTVTWAETTIASVPLTSVAGQTYSLAGQPTLSFDFSGSTPVEFVIVQTINGNGQGGVTKVRAILVAGPIIHTFERTVGDATTEFVSDNNPDPLLREAFLRSSGSYVDRLVAGGPFVELAPGPGWSLLEVEAWDVADSGYDQVDSRYPLAKHNPTRNFTVKAASLVPLVSPVGA